jgi:glycerol uptake facilitator protein
MSRRKPAPKQHQQHQNAASSEQRDDSAQPTTQEPGTTRTQRYVAEALGTFLLVLFHGGAAASLKLILHATHAPTTAPDIVFLALVDGISLFIIIMIVGKISGVLINPAVTISLASRGRFPRAEVLPYLAAQFLGASAGALVILPALGHDALTIGHLGAVELGAGVSVWQGLLVEALGTFFLVLTISATAEDPRSPSGWAAFAIGMSLSAIVLFFEPITGAPANPARSFGPDFIDALLGVPVNWGAYVLCYLLGPIIGATAAANVYYYISNQPKNKPAPEPAHDDE